MNGTDMTYKDLILLKAIFNRDLHNGIMNQNYAKIHSIMRANYINDIKMHNITSLWIDFKELKFEYVKMLEQEKATTNFEWAM